MSESPFALDISVAPPWWKTWIAYAAYVAAALCLAAMARSRYEDRVIRRRSEALAAEREIQAEEVADELEERMDLQTSLLRNVSTRNVATLHFIRDIIRNHSDTLPDSLSAQLAQETSGRVEALALLEDNLKYAEDLLLIDLYRYTSRCFEFLESRYRTAERGVAVIPVNDVARTLVPADHARRFALLIYELADNTFQHAFADTPHGGILHIRMTIRIDPRDGKARVEMVAQDSGSGIPEGMTIDDAESGGFTLIRNILTHYGGSASISVEPGRGSTVEIVLEVPDFIPEASIGASALEGYDD